MSKISDTSRWNVKTFGCSLPKPLLVKLDNVRGDVNRSRYIQRLIENKIDTIPQIRPQVGPLDESAVSKAKGAVNPSWMI